LPLLDSSKIIQDLINVWTPNPWIRDYFIALKSKILICKPLINVQMISATLVAKIYIYLILRLEIAKNNVKFKKKNQC